MLMKGCFDRLIASMHLVCCTETFSLIVLEQGETFLSSVLSMHRKAKVGIERVDVTEIQFCWIVFEFLLEKAMTKHSICYSQY